MLYTPTKIFGEYPQGCRLGGILGERGEGESVQEVEKDREGGTTTPKVEEMGEKEKKTNIGLCFALV